MNHKVLESQPEVLFEDQWLIIVYKEREELTVPGRGPDKQDCLMSRSARWFGDVYNIHRLDQPTSGLLVLAKTVEAQREMGKLFESRQVEKVYRCRVSGLVERSSGLIDLPLASDWENRPRQKVDRENGKKALTKWFVLGRGAGFTDLHLFPETGRTHQLRVHLAAIGHPILGDRLYNKDAGDHLMDRLCLHAESIGFSHPFTGELISIRKLIDFPLPDQSR